MGNASIVYDLVDWAKNLLKNVNLKNCFTVATNIKKGNAKTKWDYSGYGIAFDGAVLQDFGEML